MSKAAFIRQCVFQVDSEADCNGREPDENAKLNLAGAMAAREELKLRGDT
jgi:hypothetical protein